MIAPSRRAPRRSAHRLRAAAALAALALAGAAPGSAAERQVAFAAAAPRAGDRLSGYLSEPAGAGPFPAVALLHSCLGLPANRRAIAEALAGWGYAGLFVDEFASRGLKQTCAVDFPEAVADAYGALAFLARRPEVDPARVAVVGFSQGADAALTIAASRPAGADGPRFSAAAAFYPPCANQDGAALRIPTLIVVGGADEVTPAADCERLAAAQPAGRSQLSLVVLPGAAHEFDDPEFAGGQRRLGMALRYDADAAARAAAALRAFLAARLKR
jgi:dienelactone hydrolase